ncbi:uncharacterized protein LOC105422867 [Pogonomyrmex barbatus]|uniref:Uncharacterized protein LOC105422867 n=1 Tax=Pogonomyrmex barbatus TaxID=144034 RepID=A0A6I9VSI7_9HYME|nr:uncharacterized protein LOC105422867 [Pogonomyrmex barbatus]
MPVNRVRVLPDIPKNMPNMEILIRGFETDFRCSTSATQQDIKSKSSISNGNFVRKIIEIYESSVKASHENRHLERVKEKSDSLNSLDVNCNWKNIEKNDSNLAIHDESSLQVQDNFQKKCKTSFTSLETCDGEDDFVMCNQYYPENDGKTSSETLPESPAKINMYGTADEISINARSSFLKRNKTWNLKKKEQRPKDKMKKTKSIICSSPLGDVEDLNCENSLDDILTSSCDSSSNSSYINLQADLYDFENEQFDLSSSSSLKSFRSSQTNVCTNIGNSSIDLSFQNITVTPSKDILKDQKNFGQDSRSISGSSSNFSQKSSHVISASNEHRRVNTEDTCVTWMSILAEKLSRTKSLKKLLKSTFNDKILFNYKKVWKKWSKKRSNEHISDSGFIERFLSSTSSSSLTSWRSDLDYVDEKPTFKTFGYAENTCDMTRSENPRIVLTEVPREKFTNNSVSSNSSSYVPSDHTISCKENRQDVEPSPKLKIPCKYPLFFKHPYLSQNQIPKHPFVAETKLDQTEKSAEEKEIKYEMIEHKRKFDVHKLEHWGVSSLRVQSELNLSYPRVSEWLASSRNSNCNLLGSRSSKSTSALHELDGLGGLVRWQIPIHNAPTLCRSNTNFSSTMYYNPHVQTEFCMSRYATVSPKNLRFSMSQEKSRAIEKSFDA